MTYLVHIRTHRSFQKTMLTDTSIKALRDDFPVRLTVGTDPIETFLVPKSQIRFGWSECTGCNLAKMLKKAEKQPQSANAKSSAGNAKEGHSKIKESQSSVESLSEAPESSKVNIPEIVLPEHDPVTWSVFLR
jgi:hypothetical protein